MREIISTPLFGILVSLIAFQIACFIYAKTKLTLLNPLLISIILIISILVKFNIDLNDYNIGSQFISFFLGPATVVLAVPLYKKMELLKKHAIPILVGITSGACIGIVTIIGLSYLFKLDKSIILSLVPKSVTAPIGVEISKQLNGISSITAASIVLTGIIGAVIGPFILRSVKVHDKVAIGIAMGTASHAVGTSKAVELGETEGAMSGLSIGVAGVITVFAAPLIVKIIDMFVQ